MLELYADLSKHLMEKLAAIMNDDIDKLDSCTKAEQAYALRTRGFDRNLLKYRGKLDAAGDTLSEMIPQFPVEQQQKFSDILTSFSTVLALVRNTNDQCQKALGDRVHLINKKLEGSDPPRRISLYKEGGASDDASLGGSLNKQV